VKALTIAREALEILNQLPLGHCEQGRYISRLILEDQVRREERQKMKAAMLAVLEPTEDGAPARAAAAAR
jgi:hypothetical protein